MKLKFIFIGILIILISTNRAYADFTVNNILYNSPEAIDIAFVADGFTASEQAIFHTRVNSAIQFLFDNEPFSTYQSSFNIYSIPTISNQSGISVAGTSVVDTALKTFLNKNNLARYTGMPEEQRTQLQNELKKVFKKKLYPIIIMNTPTYGGSGEINRTPRFTSITQVTLDGQYNAFRELLVHEFGHSFGELADEYGGDCSYSEVADWDINHYDRKNVTYDAVNNRKWDTLVSNPQYILGANYCNSQWYRSSNNGIMRSLVRNSTHNELGKIILNERINEDLAYNSKVVTYQIDGPIEIPQLSDRNIRIHSDESILEENLTCNNLYVAEDSNLLVRPNIKITCNSMSILGTITYEKESDLLKNTHRTRSVRFGCRDEKAINYNRFVRHNQSFCLYSPDILRPPHYLNEDMELIAYNDYDNHNYNSHHNH